ncbi:MAG: hypothetical protein ACR2G4_12615 [Pyrinomonadaceae bacterium]
MNDWIGLGVIIVVILGGLFAAAHLGKPAQEITQEEFERRVREGASTRAGMFALQQLLHPKAAKSIEVQQDLKHSYYNKKKIPGDGDEAAPDKGHSSLSDIGERNA